MKTKHLIPVCLAVLLQVSISASTFAEIKLPSVFTNNMVLQQQSEVPVWGWAKPESTVTVISSWNHRSFTTKADAGGKWKLKISTPVAGGPYELKISDGIPVTLTNILIGEVWLCTGQSNMEMPVKGFKGQPIIGSNEAILKSRNNNIRLYIVPRSSQTVPQENSKPSEWKIADPESVANFSATGYFFGKLLNEMLNIPVGLLNVSYGGSSAEAWMEAEALKPFPDIKIPAKSDSIKQASRTPTTLYNGMLYPVIGYGIRGCIWYQGESNNERPEQYETLFPSMVKSWRSLWQAGDFPFYYVQIAPYNYGGKNNSALLRDAQRKSLDKIQNTGMAVLMDIGEEKSIHPMHKREGGERLAYLALAKTYGLKGFGAESPVFKGITVTGNIAAINFANAENGLTSFGKDLSLFEIAGADKRFYPAKAVITGSSVSISSPLVKEPVAVRYAFQDFVVGDLYGNDGLPVSSFRSDNW